jgi:hypothetical protein
MKKIAFCFLIYDVINHEELWNLFFKNIDKNLYEIYIHQKNEKRLKYFDEYKIKNKIETNYGDHTIINAFNLLFKNAYENDECYKFCIITNACIPLKSFDYVYNFLTKDDNSYFNICPKEQCFPRCNKLLEYYDYDEIQKTGSYFIINRKLCNHYINYDINEINKRYSNIFAPEEHFFITEIYKNKLENEIITTPNIPDGATTFTHWCDMNYKYIDVNNKGLKNYSYISDEELEYLVNSKSLFGRKFNIECAVSLYNNNNYICKLQKSFT